MPNAYTHLRPDAIINRSVVWEKLKDYDGIDLRVPGNIIPYKTGEHNIGNPSFRWLNVYSVNTISDYFKGGDFNGVNFTAKKMTSDLFQGGNFNGSTFSGTKFVGGDFEGSNYFGVNFTGETFTGKTFTGDTFSGTSANALKLNNRILVDNNNVFGKIPWISETGELNIGKFLDFHFDNTSNVDYSTRLVVNGNNNNIITLPIKTGTIALVSELNDLNKSLSDSITNLEKTLKDSINTNVYDLTQLINENATRLNSLDENLTGVQGNIPNGTLTISVNGVETGTFNVKEDKTIDIHVDGQDGNTTYTLKKEGNIVTLYDHNGNDCGHFEDLVGGGSEADGNTTYTFKSGTNGFTVTPSDGIEQTVVVTPSISNASSSSDGLMTSSHVQQLEQNKTDISNIKNNITSIETDIDNIQNITNSFNGILEINYVNSIPTTNKYVYSTISTSGSFSVLNNIMESGKDMHVIIYNSGSENITVSMPTASPYVIFDNDSITIPADKYAEINVISNGTSRADGMGRIFIRTGEQV